MTYPATIQYLFQQLPMFQRVGAAAYKTDLLQTYKLCSHLKNPQNNFKSVHIAGTNGKGSTSHIIASVLQEAGYKVGLYTSPHLKDFRERVKINGKVISKKKVTDFVLKHKKDFSDLSFFEWTVGLAFHHFSEEKVDIAIIETGLGGRLDSTNIISPLVSIITNIGLDHQQFLGDTIEKIATEKAGIIKKNTPVIIGETQKEVSPIFIAKAEKEGAPIIFADALYLAPLTSDLKGVYQKKNLITAKASLNILMEKGFKITQKQEEQGFLNVVKNTGLLGRWQILNHVPLTICDTAHNIAGMKYITQQLSALTYNKLHVIFGVVQDKSLDELLLLLPKNATYYICQADIPRAFPAKDLYKTMEKKFSCVLSNTVKNAFLLAKEKASEKDVIFIGGSTFTVAEALIQMEEI